MWPHWTGTVVEKRSTCSLLHETSYSSVGACVLVQLLVLVSRLFRNLDMGFKLKQTLRPPCPNTCMCLKSTPRTRKRNLDQPMCVCFFVATKTICLSEY